MSKLKTILLLIAFFSGILVYPANSRPIIASSIVTPAVSPPLAICSIPGPDFTLSSSPGLVTITGPSSRATATVTVSSLRGFSGTLSLTNSTSATGLNITLSKTSLIISKLSPGTTLLTITNTTVVAPGGYVIFVKAANSTVNRSTIVTVIVPRPGYSLSPAPFIIPIMAGSMNYSTITITSLYGFAGKVNLTTSAPTTAGITATPSKPSVTLTSPGTALFNVTVSTTTVTPHGLYVIFVTGTSGSISNSTTFFIHVIGPDFFITATPLTVILGPSSSATATINLTRVMNFNGTVALTTKVSGGTPPTQPVPTLAMPTIMLSPTMKSATDLLTITTSSTPYDYYFVYVNATSGTIKQLTAVIVIVSGLDIFPSKSAISVNAGGASNTTMITLQSVHGFSGNVTLSGSCFPFYGLIASVSPSSAVLSSGGTATSTLTVSAASDSAPGNYTVDVSGTNTTVLPTSTLVSNTTIVTVTVYGPDFKLTPASSMVSFAAGSPTTSTITVTSLLGFTGDVSFTSFMIPSIGLTVSCTTVTGAMGTSTCTYASTTPGTYAVLITGMSGSITHYLTIAVFVSDFTVSSTPSTVTFTAGTTGTSTITITALSGFTGTVGLAVSPTPSGISCSLSSTSTGPPSYPTSILGCTGSPGSYSVAVSATSGTLVHSTFLAFTITSISAPDFSLATSSPSPVNTDIPATSTIILTGQNGFSGTVTFSISAPSGLSCTISPTTITLPSSTTATLSCRSSTSGTYPVTVTATSGTVSHTQTVNVTVNSPPSSSSSTPTLLYGLVGLVIASV